MLFTKQTNELSKKIKHEFKFFGLKAYLLHLRTFTSGNGALLWFSSTKADFPFLPASSVLLMIHQNIPRSKVLAAFSSEITMASSNATQIQSGGHLITPFRWVAGQNKHNPKYPFFPPKELRRGGKSLWDFAMLTCSSYDFLNKWVKAGIRLLTFWEPRAVTAILILKYFEYARKGWCWIKDRSQNCFLHSLHLSPFLGPSGIMESQLWTSLVTVIWKCHLCVAASKGLWLPGQKKSFPDTAKSPGTVSQTSWAISLPCRRF